uniref:hypothetical protein n=1 Tax=Candidatus Limisoma sp. TaxID=3076476 RepID=UPI003FED5641
LCSNPVRGAQRSVPGSLPASAISVPEVRHFNISKKDRRISETRLSSYLYVFLYNTSSTGV